MCINFAFLLKQRGVSLIELIMFIVIISIAISGILLVMNTVTGHSSDTLIRKQALAIAESLLEEVELQDFISQSGTPATVTLLNRTTDYHIVKNYDTFAMTGITSINGAAVGLPSYNASIAVNDAGLGSILAGSAVLITVTVTDPQGTELKLSGYRTAY
jgi:MSHA pilin protein MshD